MIEQEEEADDTNQQDYQDREGEEIVPACLEGQPEAFFPVETEHLVVVDREKDGHKADADLSLVFAGQEQGEEHEEAELA